MKRTFSILMAAMVCAIGLTGCGNHAERHPVPLDALDRAEIPGMPGIRAWGGQPSKVFQADLVESIRQARAVDPRGVVDAAGSINVLALSGGGPDGAFGAGLLCGWTKAGTRPPFKLVTGISTGSLIAPFAFLGSAYDEPLKHFYTSVSTADIYTSRSPLSVLWGTDGLADTSPLANLLVQCIDDKVLAAVAAEHRKGRRLYIGTTNLEAGRIVVWNMGAIAASGRPDALQLFRDVMRASASIPVAFPPVYFDVEVEGRKYDEMHVDGGTTTQVFFYGFMLDIAAAMREAGVESKPPVRIFVVKNGGLRPQGSHVEPLLLPIAGRAVLQLCYSQGIGDLYRIYATATRDGIDFNLTYIPDEYKAAPKEMFDRVEMKRLFDFAYEKASRGYSWLKLPPGMEHVQPAANSPVTPQPQAQ